MIKDARPAPTPRPKALALLPFELQAEIAENLYRKDWTPSEIDAIRRHCQEVLRAQAKERQREHGGTAPGKHSAKLSPSDGGRAVNKIGAFARVSGRKPAIGNFMDMGISQMGFCEGQGQLSPLGPRKQVPAPLKKCGEDGGGFLATQNLGGSAFGVYV